MSSNTYYSKLYLSDGYPNFSFLQEIYKIQLFKAVYMSDITT